MVSPTTQRVVAAGVAVLLLGSCRCQPRGGEARPATPALPSASASVGAPPPPSSAPAPPGSRFASDLRWRRAAHGEPTDLEVLARSEGAVGLLEGVEVGGATARVALAALPFAPDGEVVVGRLCGRLGTTPSGQAAPLLAAIHGIVAHPPAQREALDPPGYAACRGDLARFLERVDAAPAERDLAASAARLIAEHGLGSDPK